MLFSCYHIVLKELKKEIKWKITRKKPPQGSRHKIDEKKIRISKKLENQRNQWMKRSKNKKFWRRKERYLKERRRYDEKRTLYSGGGSNEKEVWILWGLKQILNFFFFPSLKKQKKIYFPLIFSLWIRNN